MIWHGLSWLQHRNCSAFRSIRIVGAVKSQLLISSIPGKEMRCHAYAHAILESARLEMQTIITLGNGYLEMEGKPFSQVLK